MPTTSTSLLIEFPPGVDFDHIQAKVIHPSSTTGLASWIHAWNC